jgi:hypothetical protein
MGGGSGTGGGSGGITFTGTLAFPVAYAAAVWNRGPDGGVDTNSVNIGFTDVPVTTFCVQPNVAAKILALGHQGTAPVQPSTFTINGAGGADTAVYATVLPDGGSGADVYFADAGTWTLTSADLTHAIGSFQVRMTPFTSGTAWTAMGTFDVKSEICP